AVALEGPRASRMLGTRSCFPRWSRRMARWHLYARHGVATLRGRGSRRAQPLVAAPAWCGGTRRRQRLRRRAVDPRTARVTALSGSGLLLRAVARALEAPWDP